MLLAYKLRGLLFLYKRYLCKELSTSRCSKKRFPFFLPHNDEKHTPSLDEQPEVRKSAGISRLAHIFLAYDYVCRLKERERSTKTSLPILLYSILNFLKFLFRCYVQGTGVLKHCLYIFIYTLFFDYPQMMSLIYHLIFDYIFTLRVWSCSWVIVLDYSFGCEKNTHWSKHQISIIKWKY